jgi:nucleoside-triphosphatase
MVGGVLLLTGVPGIGKTAVTRRVADRLQNRRIGGFYTEEIREDSDRRGFRLVGFDGSEGVIADVDFPKVPGSGSTASTWRQSTRPPIA